MVVMFLVVGMFGMCVVVRKKIGIRLVMFSLVSSRLVMVVRGVGKVVVSVMLVVFVILF